MRTTKYVVGTNGVREDTIFNELNFFKAFRNFFYADETHDVFLGVFKVDSNDILHLLLVEYGITVEDMN